jgi:TolB-like protein
VCPPAESGVGYYLADYPSVACLGRVVFIELDAGPSSPQDADAMTAALHQSIQRRQLFHVRLLNRLDPECEDLPVEAGRVLVLEDMALIREQLGCDAVLLGSIRQFDVPPRMKIGLDLRLVDLRNGRILWAVDHIWDTTEEATVDRIRDWFECNLREAYGPANAKLVLMSPDLFRKFVAYEVGQTLRNPAEPVPEPTLVDRARKVSRQLTDE